MNYYSRLGFTALFGLTLVLGTAQFFAHIGVVNASPLSTATTKPLLIEGTDYLLSEAPGFISFAQQENRWVRLAFKNVSVESWEPTDLVLKTVYTIGQSGRPSIWMGEGWQDNSTIPSGNFEPISTGESLIFNFELRAPEQANFYKEYFRLETIAGEPLAGNPIVITMQVGNPIMNESVEEREIKIYKATQHSELIENGFVVASLPISSGKAGYTTPSGQYKIMNHFEEAYSAPYRLYMGHWMGLTREGIGYQGYGLHSLAYWKTNRPIHPDGTIKDGRLYTGNRVYEDVEHLGTPMSHGCIRYGIDEIRAVFNWAPDGTPVHII